MSRMNRRDFLMRGAAGAAAVSLGARWSHAEAPAATPSAAFKTVTLGKSGLQCTLLGMGSGTNGSEKMSDQRRQGNDYFHKLLMNGYERGLTFYDLADQYGSHENMKRLLAEPSVERSKLMIMTKTHARTPEDVVADMDRFRQELGTDYIDLVLFHCLTEGGWTEKHKAAMDKMAELKQQGVIKAHGVSCHNLDAMKEAAESPWVDVMLSRINPYGLRMDGTVEEVVAILKRARENGKGNLGMKIAGGAHMESDRLNQSLKFVLNLGCVDAITMGFVRQEEFDNFVPRIDKATTVA